MRERRETVVSSLGKGGMWDDTRTTYFGSRIMNPDPDPDSGCRSAHGMMQGPVGLPHLKAFASDRE